KCSVRKPILRLTDQNHIKASSVHLSRFHLTTFPMTTAVLPLSITFGILATVLRPAFLNPPTLMIIRVLIPLYLPLPTVVTVVLITSGKLILWMPKNLRFPVHLWFVKELMKPIL